MSPQPCPACGRSCTEIVQRVDVAGLHALLLPAEAALQQRLTAAAAEAAMEYAMLRCPGCGLEFASPLRAPSPEWYRLMYSALDLYPASRWEFDQVLRSVGPGQTLLEAGCGAGAFLELCRRRGISASGVDLSEDAVRSCLMRGLVARPLALGARASDEGIAPAHHLAGFHVLEHLDAPGALFDYASRHALPGSRLWLSVPSERRVSRHFGQRELLDDPPHHMTRWSSAALAAIGARHGWRLAQVDYEPLAPRKAARAISAGSPAYRRWEAAGLFRDPRVERGFRALLFPMALLRSLTTLRRLGGHSMLAQFDFRAVPSPGPQSEARQ